MLIILFGGMVLILFCCCMLWRNHLIYKIRMRALAEISLRVREAIDRGESANGYYQQYDDYGNYEEMLYDLSRWRFSQFYPGL